MFLNNIKKILVVITARPSYSRIKSALVEMKRDATIDLKILCAASALLERYGRIVEMIRADGFNVAEEIYTHVEGNEPVNMALTVANGITQTASILRRLQPDFVITIADRYETLGTAVAAAYLGIPLIHVQGGEITGNIDEKVRHAVTKLSDVHLVATPAARSRLINMGEDPATIYVTGCPSVDLARESLKIEIADVQNEVNKLGIGENINLHKPYIVVLQHPETENYSDSYSQTRMLLESVSEFDLQVLVFWPNVDAGSDGTSKAIRVFREESNRSGFRYIKNMDGRIYLRMLYFSKCIVGNSSVAIRECAYLGTPAVNIGDRQNGRDSSANVINCKWNKTQIIAAIKRQLSVNRYNSSSLYGDGYAGQKIAGVIQALTDVKTTKRFYE
jgi:UDP-hydrolysing UDP-N-acetyl-D-glucosamine 2-epimerase